MEALLTDEEIESRLSPVNSHNEWDPLEEIIVGRLEGATMPSNHPVVTCNIPNKAAARAQSLVAGLHYPRIMVEPAQRELDGFVALLQSIGIIVRRPETVDHKKQFSTPSSSSRGFCNSCPRDAILVVGDEIIETPMFGRAATSRHFPIALSKNGGLNRSLASSCTMPHSVELSIVLRWTSAGEVHCKAISDPGYDRRDRRLLAVRRQRPV